MAPKWIDLNTKELVKFLNGLTILDLWFPIYLASSVLLLISQTSFMNHTGKYFYEDYLWLIISVFSAAFMLTRGFFLKHEEDFFYIKKELILKEKLIKQLSLLMVNERKYLILAVKSETNAIIGNIYDPALILLCERKLIRLIENSNYINSTATFLVHDCIWEVIKNDSRFSGNESNGI